MEADRNAWRDRARNAEGKLEHEVICSKATEATVAAATRGLELARKTVEELTGRLSATEEQVSLAEAWILATNGRANAAWSQVQATKIQAREAGRRAEEVEERAGQAEERASQAEERAGQANELNKELSQTVKEISGTMAQVEEEARKANAAQLLAAAQLWDAEARFEEAESRAWRVEAEAKEATEKMKRAVDNAIHSPAIKRELVEAAADAYLMGFIDCKKKMALTYRLENTEAIHPGDRDDPETPGADAEEASSADGEEAGSAAGDTPGP